MTIERLSGLPSTALVVFNDPTPDAPDLAMMGKRINTPIASAEKCAEQPTDNRNDDSAEKGRPEAGHLKTGYDLADEFQHQRVDD
jgi:hypothetical protein